MLLSGSAHRRLATKLNKLPDLECVCLNDDGQFVRGTDVVSREDLDISMVLIDMDLFSAHPKMISECLIKLPALAFVQSVTAGLDNPLFKNMIEKTDVFCRSDAQAPAISEFVVGSVMNRWHRFDVRRERQSDGQWQGMEFKQIYGSHWLIVGYGNIGEGVARFVKSADATVTGLRRSVAPSPHADHIAALDNLYAELPKADVVLLSCPLNEATRNMAGADFFAAMKPDAVLVNIGRGELLDETALVAALDSNQLDYAILDVFRTEPLPEGSPLWSHQRVQVSPHDSHHGSATGSRFDKLFLDNLDAFFAGGEFRNLVSKREFA